MHTTHSSNSSSPPLLSSVAEEAWSFCLNSQLLASFLDDASDLCSLSICGRDFVPFRTQIWRVRHMSEHKLSVLTDAIISRRLPCLSGLDLDLYDIEWENKMPLILEYITAGHLPSLKHLRLTVFSLDYRSGEPLVHGLMALPHLEHLQMKCEHCEFMTLFRLKSAPQLYPHVTLRLCRM